jgi:hypothetical protein
MDATTKKLCIRAAIACVSVTMTTGVCLAGPTALLAACDNGRESLKRTAAARTATQDVHDTRAQTFVRCRRTAQRRRSDSRHLQACVSHHQHRALRPAVAEVLPEGAAGSGQGHGVVHPVHHTTPAVRDSHRTPRHVKQLAPVTIRQRVRWRLDVSLSTAPTARRKRRDPQRRPPRSARPRRRTAQPAARNRRLLG